MKSVELSNQARVHENCGIPKGRNPLAVVSRGGGASNGWGSTGASSPLAHDFLSESLVCYTFAETVLNENGIRPFDA